MMSTVIKNEEIEIFNITLEKGHKVEISNGSQSFNTVVNGVDCNKKRRISKMNNIQVRNEIIGTVYAETRKGALIRSDDLPQDAFCFCPGCLRIGDRALFTIKKFTYLEDKVKITLSYDSMIEYAYTA